jgi:hypothetical protein
MAVLCGKAAVEHLGAFPLKGVGSEQAVYAPVADGPTNRTDVDRGRS